MRNWERDDAENKLSHNRCKSTNITITQYMYVPAIMAHVAPH